MYNGKYRGQRLPRRIICMALAVFAMGLGVSICVLANMGADPCSTMNLGISSAVGLSFGAWQAIMNVLMLIAVLFFDRSLIGLGTFCNMFIIGFTADFFQSVWGTFLVPSELSVVIRILLTFLGTGILLTGCSVYMTANLGMAPYDCVAFVILNLSKRRNLKYRWVRVIQDAAALVIGFVFGAAVGLGTVIMVFLSGPLIPLLNRYVAAPILGIQNLNEIRTER